MADETYGIVINVQSNKAKRELQAIDEKLADLQDKKTVFIQAKTELTKQLVEIEKLDYQLDDLKKKKVKIQLDIDNAWKEKLEEVEKAKDRIAKNTNRLVELQPVIDEIKELDSAIERYKKNIKELQSNLKLGNTSNGESLDVQKELCKRIVSIFFYFIEYTYDIDLHPYIFKHDYIDLFYTILDCIGYLTP